MVDEERDLETAAGWIAEGGVVALTGAGLSVDSGVPDFRSAGGLWDRFSPTDYATIGVFRDNPERSWRFFTAVNELLARARPNPGHRALAELESMGLLDGVVTQNIDHLHQHAGARRVVEYHGNVEHLHCLWCGAHYHQSSIPPDEDGVPYCLCGRPLKPTVVLFGEAIPSRAMTDGESLIMGARTVIVVGTSGEVVPAGTLPLQAKEAGARLIEVNVRPSSLTSSMDVSLRGPASDLLPALVEAVQQRPRSAS